MDERIDLFLDLLIRWFFYLEERVKFLKKFFPLTLKTERT